MRWRSRQRIRQMAFIPGGKFLLSADQPGKRRRGFRAEPMASRLHLWDFSSGRLLKRSPEFERSPNRPGHPARRTWGGLLDLSHRSHAHRENSILSQQAPRDIGRLADCVPRRMAQARESSAIRSGGKSTARGDRARSAIRRGELG